MPSSLSNLSFPNTTQIFFILLGSQSIDDDLYYYISLSEENHIFLWTLQ